MPYSQNYGNVIWTNHALDRLIARRLPQYMAYDTFRFPDTYGPGKQSGTTEFIKKINHYAVTVIATKNEKGEWIIVSCWVDPPFAGSIDVKKQEQWQAKKQQQKEFRKKYNNASFWGKLFLELRRQIFGK